MHFIDIIQDIIKQDVAIKNRKIACKVYGKYVVVVNLIKNKTFGERVRQFLTELRLSKNFRER